MKGRMLPVAADCAGVVFGFPGTDSRWRAAVRRRFAGFLTDAPPSFRIHRGPATGGPTGAGSNRSEPGLFGTAVDLAAATAELPADSGASQAGYLVRSLLPTLLVDGLVAHAAVLVDGERGFLCCGRSGAGKSTLANLAGPGAGSEELGAVRLEGGAWMVHTLPFRKARRASARLEGIYLLAPGPRDERQRLSPASAIPAVGRHLFWPVDSLASGQRSLDLLAGLVENVPVWDLEFLPTPAVWDLIVSPPGKTDGSVT
jgi:hypothetical protein